jgi:hypothetical protein
VEVLGGLVYLDRVESSTRRGHDTEQRNGLTSMTWQVTMERYVRIFVSTHDLLSSYRISNTLPRAKEGSLETVLLLTSIFLGTLPLCANMPSSLRDSGNSTP